MDGASRDEARARICRSKSNARRRTQVEIAWPLPIDRGISPDREHLVHAASRSVPEAAAGLRPHGQMQKSRTPLLRSFGFDQSGEIGDSQKRERLSKHNLCSEIVLTKLAPGLDFVGPPKARDVEIMIGTSLSRV